MATESKSFKDRNGFIWYDGEMKPWKEAEFHVLSHSLHYGSGVFEGERAYNGVIFKSLQHTERLINSARILGYQIPYSAAEIEKAKQEVINKNDIKNAYLRPIAWRGSEEMGLGAKNCRIHLAIAAWDWPSYFSDEQLKKGLRLKIATWRRPPPGTAPFDAKAAGLYMICTMSKHNAMENGYDDALMLDWRGRISECTAANLFFVMNGELHTPVADCFLNGITRQTVIELAKELGIKVVERAILPEEMSKFQECFVTGTAVEIVPVGEVENYKFVPGETTFALRNAYIKATGR